MERIRLPFFYILGVNLHALAYMDETSQERASMYLILYNAKDSIEQLLKFFTPELRVCRPQGKELIDAIGDWEKQSWVPDKYTVPLALDERFRARLLVQKAKTFEIVLSAELETLATYHASQKAAYSTPDLIEHAENVLPGSARSKVTEQVVHELRECGRCLVFDNSTAAGFHALRATEAVMHEYYIAVCEPKPKPKERLSSWGSYLTEFDKAKATKPHVGEVLAILQQIKDRHRNLIMHPEVVLSPDEALTLFEITQGAIIAMAMQMPNPKPKKKTNGN